MKKEDRALLKMRATKMALEPEISKEASASLNIIAFSLSSEIYGIESDFVSEVYPMKDFTPLPGVPSYIIGVMNVKGKVLAVIDLKKFFHLTANGLGELNKVIIVQNNEMEFGILADTVQGVQSISMDIIKPAPHAVSGIGEEYLMGVTPGRIIVLNAESLLNDKKLVVNID